MNLAENERTYSTFTVLYRSVSSQPKRFIVRTPLAKECWPVNKYKNISFVSRGAHSRYSVQEIDHLEIGHVRDARHAGKSFFYQKSWNSLTSSSKSFFLSIHLFLNLSTFEKFVCFSTKRIFVIFHESSRWWDLRLKSLVFDSLLGSYFLYFVFNQQEKYFFSYNIIFSTRKSRLCFSSWLAFKLTSKALTPLSYKME